MRWGYDHRPVSELRPDDPCHGNGKSRDVNMDDVTIQGSTSIHPRGTEGNLIFEKLFSAPSVPLG
jgi:hypothetical protein